MGGAEKSHDVMGYVRRNRVQCHGLLHVQVKDPSLQERQGHSATAFSLTPTLTEVVLFGGYSGDQYIADTTVLQFSKSPTTCITHSSLYCC